MSPLAVHLVVVHVPVVGLVFAALTALAATLWNDRRLMVLTLTFTALCVIGGVVAYASGPPTYDLLRTGLDPPTLVVADNHAILGKISFAALVFLGIGVIQIGIRWAGGTPPSQWAFWALTALLCLAASLLAFTAHLGGTIRHHEVWAAPTASDPR